MVNKKLALGVIAVALFSVFASKAKAEKLASTAYGFEFQNLDEDGKIKLSDYKGKVVMVVNTASQCGFTPQYAQLQELYKKYKDKGLVIVGVPSNDFGNQEPGTGKEIAKFCEINYGVTFPLTSKYVVSGKNAHPFFLWAASKLGAETVPKWNFHKYLISRQGKLVDYFSSNTTPDSDKIVSEVEKLLAQK